MPTHAVSPPGRVNGCPAPRAGAVAAARRVGEAIGPRWLDRTRERGAGDGLLGVVLGTGLGGLADRLVDAVTLSARDTSWLVPSTATGHAGRLVVGTMPGRGREVVILQGRVHGYEGHPPERLSRGIELLAALGATTVLVTNAAGGLRPDMRAGELVVVSDHIDLVRRRWTEGIEPPGRGGPADAAGIGRVAAAGSCYDPRAVAGMLAAAWSADASARAGVYAMLSGPSYETRAEYRMLRKFGADVVGMSTVPEAVVAGRLGLRAAAVSVVTNVARPDAPARTDAEDVCRAAAAAAEGMWAIIGSLADATAGAGRSGPWTA